MEERADPDPTAELAHLAAGLAAHLRRREARGRPRVAASAPPAVAPGPQAAPTAKPPADAPADPARPRDWIQPQPPPPGKRSRPEPAAPGGARAEPAGRQLARIALQRQAAEVAERAQACADLDALRAAVAGCTACGLCETRTQTVFSDGRGAARVMFVGEAPGADEDARGVPFVGRAGQLLTDIITKGMGLAREQVYIANVLKCRPPGNRDPSEVEKATCTPWLDRQIELLDPAVIIPLGRHAANHVLGTDLPMGRLRGQVHERGGRKVVPTFHPAYLLRSPGMKKECWQDIQLAMGLLGLAAPPRSTRGGSGS